MSTKFSLNLPVKDLGAGGKPDGEDRDLGFLYGRGFTDPDGHQWRLSVPSDQRLVDACLCD